MKRKIISIDSEKCDGCGLCIPECKEGAIQIIEGKARLVNDLFCDGLGACLGYCPLDAITIEEREAEPYNEIKVIESLLKEPQAVLESHLIHLLEHGAEEYFKQAIHFLKENGYPIPVGAIHAHHPEMHHGGSCPGSKIVEIKREHSDADNFNNVSFKSELTQWPIQLHLVNPSAPYFKGSELLIMSTCGPLVSGEIHQKYLRGRSIVVACPKLDNTEPYTQKLASIFANGKTPRAIVVIIEVPCCRGLTQITLEAAELSGRDDLIIEEHVLTLNGNLKSKSIVYGNEVLAEV